jgi:cytochrome b pre-mRNA-processing protein 3
MDTTSRELGVGDLTVPKKMRVLAAVFEERMAAYKKAFEDKDPRLLSDEFQQNIFAGNDASQVQAKELVRYAEMLRTRLMDTSIQEFMGDEYNAGRDFWVQ